MIQDTCDAVIYARTSSSFGGRSYDVLIEQVDQCVQHAKDNRMTIVKSFLDVSDDRLQKRPGLQRLLEYLGKCYPAVTAVVISDKTRLSRSYQEYCQIWNEISDLGAVIIPVRLDSQSLDSSTRHGKE